MFTMIRRGSFIHRAAGPHHCGTKRRFTINYKVEVRCDGESLDERGFLFDQLNVARLFLRMGEEYSELSCEEMARALTKALVSQCETENPQVLIHYASVTLSPEPFEASITYQEG